MPLREERGGVREWLEGHFLARGRGVAGPAEHGDFFSGRGVALEELVGWLTAPEGGGGLCVVTGDPGSGKSAVLGRLVAQSDPRARKELDPSVDTPGAVLSLGVIDAFVLVRGLALDGVARAIAAQLNATENTAAELAAAGAGGPRVVVVDALDEALREGEARRIAQRLLRPLGDAGARVLVGTRRGPQGELIAAPGASRRVIDLDDERYLEL